MVREGYISYKKRNILPLFLKVPDALTDEDIKVLRDFYFNSDKFKDEIEINKIVPFAAHIVSTLDIVDFSLSEKHLSYRKRNEKIIIILDELFLNFEAENCVSVSLTENFASLLLSGGCLACFCSGDVDLSADINEIDAILKVMTQAGFQLTNPIESFGEYNGQSAKFEKVGGVLNGFRVNIVWKPVTRAFLDQSLYEKRLSHERLKSERFSNTNIKILNDTALLYFCCLHIASGHYYTLSPGARLYVDIDRLVRAREIDWDKILQWSQDDNAGYRITLVLKISNLLLGTPLPKDFEDLDRDDLQYKLLMSILIKNESLFLKRSGGKISRLLIEILSDGGNIIESYPKKIWFLMLSIYRSWKSSKGFTRLH